MSAWGKTRGNQLGYRIFVALIKIAGVLPAYVLLRFVTIYYFFFLARPKNLCTIIFKKDSAMATLKRRWPFIKILIT